MKTRYIYRNKKSGVKIHTNQKLDEKYFELIFERRDGMIKDNEVEQKNAQIHD